MDELADLDPVDVRGDHLADAVRPHHLADPDRRDVRADVVEPAALGRIEREPDRPHDKLAIGRLGHLLFDELEVAVGDLPGRALAQAELAVGGRGHGISLGCPGRLDSSVSCAAFPSRDTRILSRPGHSTNMASEEPTAQPDRDPGCPKFLMINIDLGGSPAYRDPVSTSSPKSRSSTSTPTSSSPPTCGPRGCRAAGATSFPTSAGTTTSKRRRGSWAPTAGPGGRRGDGRLARVRPVPPAPLGGHRPCLLGSRPATRRDGRLRHPRPGALPEHRGVRRQDDPQHERAGAAAR